MLPGVQYNQTYAPVAAWEYIRILLSTLLCNNWKTMQVDYRLYITQAPVERECYMNTPKGIEVQSDTEWVLKDKDNIYGKYQTGRVRNKI